ncbi:hypothetical protein K504DRAFT_477545 [Pleomassaria siparia CBS 279.74]|uniref:Uncharacterized protein n=1 Tax=Pleomassaria siparia CBS 279.74 TaxID=1314801 RepID=A0A6G1K599_9PLEO|nr:hypothetical protein K504DRAFT_477545 [Pleomassaria siparia CBS 279.74]
MPGPVPNAYSLLESSFQASPNLRSHRSLPRRREELRNILPAAEPLKQDISQSNDETDSLSESERPTLLPSPESLDGVESGLPPTPPSNSQDERPSSTFSLPPYADAVVTSLSSTNSSLTPVNQRSPLTPDPSPPRTTESMTTIERPLLFACPSSRPESFKTAKEDQSSDISRPGTPLVDRLSTVEEDRGYGLGLAFESEDGDATPTNRIQSAVSGHVVENKLEAGQGEAEVKDPLIAGNNPDREWNTELMRNITIRKKRNPKPSPQKKLDAVVTPSPPTASTPRRTSSLRERVEASKNSPHTPSFESFARSIGWPAATDSNIPRENPHDVDHKRFSGASMTSTIVEAMVIVTPPQRRRALRHSGKNLAYRGDADFPTDHRFAPHSKRSSLNSDEIPLHQLVHKRVSINGRQPRASIDSSTLRRDWHASSPISIRRGEENVAFTLAHQDSVRRVLQPAADIMSRTNFSPRPYTPERGYHKRIASAPEATRRRDFTPEPRSFLELSSTTSPSETVQSSTSPPPQLHGGAPSSPVLRSLPRPPQEVAVREIPRAKENHSPATQHEVVSNEDHDDMLPVQSEVRELLKRQRSSSSTVPTVRQERRRSSTSQDRTSTSRDGLLRPTWDRTPTDELPRHSSEWHAMRPDGTRRVSLDASTIRTEEHAMARHLYAQTTPFSQISDTPIEVSEATAVSIYPHNNHSLLVVQQISRPSTQAPDQRQIVEEVHHRRSEPPTDSVSPPPTPPFVDAIEEQRDLAQHPTLTFEPSTPPMQMVLPSRFGVESPLKNPRKPPEPPTIQFIPPTPAEELEPQLMPTFPGPPKRSDSHPQRCLTLVQRARRYSDNLISPFLSRASSTRSRHGSNSHSAHENPRIPTVNDEDGSLHPFWRPRGFWDGFEESDSDSDDALPQGGDTSDVEDPEPEAAPKKLNVLGRRLTSGFKNANGFKNTGGFLIGNSLGVERSGTNKRRPHIVLPPQRVLTKPKILVQPPTIPLSMRSRSTRVEKRVSRSSLPSNGTYERSRRAGRRDAWKKGKTIPGLNMQVQYIGLSGVKERIKEKKAEKRRESIRKSIGSRYYVEGGTCVT